MTYKTNESKKGYGVAHLPLYINHKFTGEYVIYVADLPYEKFEIVTDKTFYYEIDFRDTYILINDDSIEVNTAYNFNHYINENYFK